MATGRLEQIATIIGFVAYHVAVGAGLPERELLAASLSAAATRPGDEAAGSNRSEGAPAGPAPLPAA